MLYRFDDTLVNLNNVTHYVVLDDPRLWGRLHFVGREHGQELHRNHEGDTDMHNWLMSQSVTPPKQEVAHD